MKVTLNTDPVDHPVRRLVWNSVPEFKNVMETVWKAAFVPRDFIAMASYLFNL